MQYSKSDFRISKRFLLAGGVFIGLSSLESKTLSPRQESIVLGNILGDGHMQLAPNKKSARLRYNHSMKQADYVKWQYQELDWLSQGVSQPKEIIEKEKYQICRAYTAYKPELKTYHSYFYQTSSLPKRRFEKRIPETIADYLKAPEALMIWYLDDGTLRQSGGTCRLATQCFTLQEHEILQEALDKNFGIKSVIEKWPGGKAGLYIPARGGHARNFVGMFRSTIEKEIPSMKYKIDGYS